VTDDPQVFPAGDGTAETGMTEAMGTSDTGAADAVDPVDAPVDDAQGDNEPVDNEPSDDEPGFEVPDPPQTGDPEVDQAVAALAVAVGGPLEEQLAVYESAHRTLQDRLADVEG
jgi:hypothetical protein